MIARHRTLLRRAIAIGVCCGALTGFAVSCGRKGPPLAPLVRLPGPIIDLTAKRLADQVVLQFTIPMANSDNSRPADISRIEVYAHTGPLPAPADFLKYGSLIGNIAVQSAAGPGGTLPGVTQGAKAAAAETITEAQLEPGKSPVIGSGSASTSPSRGGTPPARGAGAGERADGSSAAAPVFDLETEGTVNAPIPVLRYYVAVGVSRRNRRGAFSAPVAVPLLTPPNPSTGLQSEYTEEGVTLTWKAPPRSEDMFAPSPAYNIYDVTEAAGTATGGTAAAPATPSAPPLNPGVVLAPTYKDTRIEFGTKRCYAVRTVRIAGAVSIESAPTDPICVTPVDTFPPAAPKSLAAVASENAINLIWEPNTERDLAGYLVLRGEAPGETLSPLMTAPIHETTYRDATVMAGVSYVYAVVAVDNAPKPNVSEHSNLVTEIVR